MLYTNAQCQSTTAQSPARGPKIISSTPASTSSQATIYKPSQVICKVFLLFLLLCLPGTRIMVAVFSLKVYSTYFTHEVQFTSHEECYPSCENSCIMSSRGALSSLRNEPDAVMVMSSGLFWLRLETERSHYRQSLRLENKRAFRTQGGPNERCCWVAFWKL